MTAADRRFRDPFRQDEAARPFGYVHRSERPLATAVLIPEDAGQLTLECEGMCGV
jgi:hypothetical protein